MLINPIHCDQEMEDKSHYLKIPKRDNNVTWSIAPTCVNSDYSVNFAYFEKCQKKIVFLMGLLQISDYV